MNLDNETCDPSKIANAISALIKNSPYGKAVATDEPEWIRVVVQNSFIQYHTEILVIIKVVKNHKLVSRLVVDEESLVCYGVEGSLDPLFNNINLELRKHCLHHGLLNIDGSVPVSPKKEIVYSWKPTPDPWGISGAMVKSVILDMIPGIDDIDRPFDCPACADRRMLLEMVIHLNDVHMWPREHIADYLDSMHEEGTVDLSVHLKGDG